MSLERIDRLEQDLADSRLAIQNLTQAVEHLSKVMVVIGEAVKPGYADHYEARLQFAIDAKREMQRLEDGES
jgi:hypothetical protein